MQAPFMLFVEVLTSEDEEEEEEGKTNKDSDATWAQVQGSPFPGHPQPPLTHASMCGDSAVSLLGANSIASSATDSAFAAAANIAVLAGGMQSASLEPPPRSLSLAGVTPAYPAADTLLKPLHTSASHPNLAHHHLPLTFPHPLARTTVPVPSCAGTDPQDSSCSLPPLQGGLQAMNGVGGGAGCELTEARSLPRSVALYSMPQGPMVIPQRRRKTVSSISFPSSGTGTGTGSADNSVHAPHLSGSIALAAGAAASPPLAGPGAAYRRSATCGEALGSSGSGGGLSGVVRSLCFAEPSVMLPDLPLPPAAALESSSSINLGELHTTSTHATCARLARPMGAAIAPRQNTLTEADMEQLIQAGCLSPPSGNGFGGASGNSVMHQMGAMMASLRGEAPLVKLHIKVLQPPAAPVPASGSDGSAAGLASAAGASPAPTVDGSEAGGAGSGDEGAGSGLLSSAKALSLLHKFGLCTKPAVASAAGGKGGPGSGRLVAVSLEVAGGLNLSITSPYRKSRRTPSHEAISLVASKLKISQIPPPQELGPPLIPPNRSFTFKGRRKQRSGGGAGMGADDDSSRLGVESSQGSATTVNTMGSPRVSFTTMGGEGGAGEGDRRSGGSSSWILNTGGSVGLGLQSRGPAPNAIFDLTAPTQPAVQAGGQAHVGRAARGVERIPANGNAPYPVHPHSLHMSSADCAAIAATAAAAASSTFGSFHLPGSSQGVVSAAAAAAQPHTPTPSEPPSFASPSPPLGSSPTRTRASSGSMSALGGPPSSSGFSLLRSLQSAGQQLQALAQSLTAGSSAAPTAVIDQATAPGMPRRSSTPGLTSMSTTTTTASTVLQLRSAREEREREEGPGSGAGAVQGAAVAAASSGLFGRKSAGDSKHKRSASAANVSAGGGLSSPLGGSIGGSTVRALLSRSTHGSPPPALPPPAPVAAVAAAPPKLDAASEAMRKDAWAVYGERWTDKVRGRPGSNAHTRQHTITAWGGVMVTSAGFHGPVFRSISQAFQQTHTHTQ